MKCKVCGTSQKHEPCADCGKIVHVGEWYNCPHGKPSPSKGFEPYFDIGLGEHITGVGDIKKHCRPQWNNDYVTQLQERR